MPSVITNTGWTATSFNLPGQEAKARAIHAKSHDEQLIRQKGVLLGVVDGSPSGSCHEKAAEIVSQTLLKSYYAPESGSDPVEALRYAVQNSVMALDTIKDARCSELSIALVAAVVQGSHVYIARVGDPVIYACNNDRITLITTDPIDYGSISEASAEIEPGDRLLLCTTTVTASLDDESLQALMKANIAASKAVDSIRIEFMRMAKLQHGAAGVFDYEVEQPNVIDQTLRRPETAPLPETVVEQMPARSALAPSLRSASDAADAALSAVPMSRAPRSGQRAMGDGSIAVERFNVPQPQAQPLPETGNADRIPVEYARSNDGAQEKMWPSNTAYTAPVEEMLPKTRTGQGTPPEEPIAARRGQRSAEAEAAELALVLAKPAKAGKAAKPSKKDDKKDKDADNRENWSQVAAAALKPIVNVGKVQPFQGEAIIIPARRTPKAFGIERIPVARRRGLLPDPFWLRVMGAASLLAVPLVICALSYATGLLGSATSRASMAVGLITPTSTSTPTSTPTNTPTPTATPVPPTPTATVIPPTATFVPTQTPFVVIITAVPTQTPVPTETPVPPAPAPTLEASATPTQVAGSGTTRRVVRSRPVVVRRRATPVPPRVVRPVVRPPVQNNGGGQPPLPPPPP